MKLLMKTLSSLEKVFLDEEPMRVSTAHSALMNESSAFQIAYTVVPEEGDEAKYAGSVKLGMEIISPIKEFIRVFQLFPFSHTGSSEFFTTNEDLDIDSTTDDGKVLGIPVQYFTQGQLEGIRKMVHKVKEDNRKNGIRL